MAERKPVTRERLEDLDAYERYLNTMDSAVPPEWSRHLIAEVRRLRTLVEETREMARRWQQVDGFGLTDKRNEGYCDALNDCAEDVLDALAPQVAPKGNRIYVAGPISKGDRESNYATAIDAADRLLVAGWNPYVPHLCLWWHERYPHTHAEWMAHDFVWVAACDALVRLPGESDGADQEVALACRLGIPVYNGIEAVPGPVPDETDGVRERARRTSKEYKDAVADKEASIGVDHA